MIAQTATTIRHVYTRGGERDRRFRMGNGGQRVHGPTFCGARETPQSLSRASAEALLAHAAIFRARGERSRALEDAAELCPTCTAAMSAAKTTPRHSEEP